MTMAAVVPPVIVPPGGPHLLAVVPQLPHGAHPGTITGWLLESTTTETWEKISRDLEIGFNHLVNNVPDVNDAGYEAFMGDMTMEIISSDTLTPYLVATNICNNVVRVIHSIARYSAGFGGNNALHGHTLALLGETVGAQLPLLVRFMMDVTKDEAVMHSTGIHWHY
jgi:hypothetical protein